MRMIMAVIQPTKLSVVRDALQDAGVQHMTICDAMGYGRQRGQMASFRGNEYKVDLLRKIVLEIVVSEGMVETAIETIRRTARAERRGAENAGARGRANRCRTGDGPADFRLVHAATHPRRATRTRGKQESS